MPLTAVRGAADMDHDHGSGAESHFLDMQAAGFELQDHQQEGILAHIDEKNSAAADFVMPWEQELPGSFLESSLQSDSYELARTGPDHHLWNHHHDVHGLGFMTPSVISMKSLARNRLPPLQSMQEGLEYVPEVSQVPEQRGLFMEQIPSNQSPYQVPGLSSSTLGDNDGLETVQLKAEIIAHPLYPQLLEAHMACLKVATPLDQIGLLEAQLENADAIADKYLSAVPISTTEPAKHNMDLDWFMAHFVVLLRSFKGQLEQHVRVHAREAVLACWELEQTFRSITGVEPGPGTGLLMSDDDEEVEPMGDSELEPFLDASEPGNFGLESTSGGSGGPYGPLRPSEKERSILESMRQELKKELKQGYHLRIKDVHDEIMRKRRAGKLPNGTTEVLKEWWTSHVKWPYPSEEEKMSLVKQTGLELKQINNWFINQRKRNWHTSGSSLSSPKKAAKRKHRAS